MAKKFFGRLIGLAAVAGAVAAGVSYALQYRSFHKDLEEEFHDFEDGYSDIKSSESKPVNRNYVALKSDKNDFVLAARDTANAALGMAGAAKEMLKDVGNIIKDNASSAGSLAADTAKEIVEPVVKKASASDEEDETVD